MQQPIAPRRTASKGQRSEQRDATHRRIFEAARKLFTEKGYFETRSTDIAKAAGCSTGSVFAHFDSKAKVMTAVMAEVYSRRLDLLRAATWQSDTALGRLREIVRLLWRDNYENRDLMRAFYSYSWFHDDEDMTVFSRYLAERNATVLKMLGQTADWAAFSAGRDMEAAFRLLHAYHETLLRESAYVASEILELRLMGAIDLLFAPPQAI